MKRKIFVFIGAPASGKGTRIEELTKLGMKCISASKLLKDAGVDIEAGTMASDELIISLIDKAITANSRSDIIIDGFPRTLGQAEALLSNNNLQVDKLFYIVADKDLVIQRATDRLICPTCRSVYSKSFKKPKRIGICDCCDTILVKRKDDTTEIIEKRFQQFEETVIGITQLFEASNVQIVKIDARLPPREVLKYI